MGEQKQAEWYNKVFATDKMYAGDYNSICYYEMWKQLIKEIQDDCFFKGKLEKEYRIYDMGCGPGQFAHMLQDNGFTNYCGYDFSEVAIKKARKLSGQFFEQADLYKIDCNIMTHDADCILMLEVLEHLKEDLKVLKQIKEGKRMIITLPTFDGTSHVRYFKDSAEILKRYGPYIVTERCYTFGNHIVLICKKNDKR